MGNMQIEQACAHRIFVLGFYPETPYPGGKLIDAHLPIDITRFIILSS
jgi:hypothetical protein